MNGGHTASSRSPTSTWRRSRTTSTPGRLPFQPITGGTATILLVQEFTDEGGVNNAGDGDPDVAEEIRGFNGNRIQISSSSLRDQRHVCHLQDHHRGQREAHAHYQLSRPLPLISKGRTWSSPLARTSQTAASGYTTTNTASGTTGGINLLTDEPGHSWRQPTARPTTGGVRLVIAGNVVALDEHQLLCD